MEINFHFTNESWGRASRVFFWLQWKNISLLYFSCWFEIRKKLIRFEGLDAQIQENFLIGGI